MIKYALSLTRNGKAYAIPLLLHLYPFAFGGIPLLQNLMLQCYHSLGTRGSVVVPLCIIRSFILLPHSCYLTARSPVPVDFYTCTVRILIDNTWSVFYRALGTLGLTRSVLLMYWCGEHCERFGDVPVVCRVCLLAPVSMLEENKTQDWNLFNRLNARWQKVVYGFLDQLSWGSEILSSWWSGETESSGRIEGNWPDSESTFEVYNIRFTDVAIDIPPRLWIHNCIW
jgi:hypothetical protein